MGNKATCKGDMLQARIAFVHNYYIKYRTPLFESLARKYDVRFFFDEIHPFLGNMPQMIGFKVPLSVRIRSLIFPVTLLWHLLKSKSALFIAGDATNPSTFQAFVASKLLRKPFILWEERWCWVGGVINLMIWPIARLISLKAEVVIVPGRKSWLFYKRIGVKKDRLFLAPNASYAKITRFDEVRAQQLRKQLDLQRRTVILYMGRVVKMKGVYFLLRAFARLCKERNDVFLLIAGQADQEYLKVLERARVELGLRDVRFIGFVPESQKGSYLKLADIVVYPSVFDVWGLVINEAMLAGKPIISTTGTGGAFDLVEDGANGYVVPPGDAVALYHSLRKLIENPQAVKEFGRVSRRKIKQGFTYRNMINGFENAIQQALRCSE